MAYSEQALAAALLNLLLENSITSINANTVLSGEEKQIIINQIRAQLTQLTNGIAGAIASYVTDRTVTFSSGTVTGTCPVGGGDLTLGEASNGIIS